MVMKEFTFKERSLEKPRTTAHLLFFIITQITMQVTYRCLMKYANDRQEIIECTEVTCQTRRKQTLQIHIFSTSERWKRDCMLRDVTANSSSKPVSTLC